MTHPIEDGMSQKEYIDAIIAESNREGAEAAEFGSIMHKAIEDYLSGYPVELDDEINEREVKSFASIKENILDKYIESGETEISLSSKEYGFGGRIDFYGRLTDGSIAIVDWKSQNIKWKN